MTSGHQKPKPIAVVDGQPISIHDMRDLIETVDDLLRRKEGFTLYTLNLDHLVKRRRDPGFRRLYAKATIVTADGWPIVRLARRQASRLERTAGSDLVVPLCRLAGERGVPVALFGSSPDVLGSAAKKLTDISSGLKITFSDAPPLGFDPVSAVGDAAIDRIAASGARICFVALGAPKQEAFSERASESCPGVGFVCIGAALDFIAGSHRRAPKLLQSLGLEWAWRLLLQPRRLGLRYLRCALLFAKLIVASDNKPLVAKPLVRS